MSSRDNQQSQTSPIASPISSSNKPPLTSANGDLGARNDGAHTGTTPSRRAGQQRTPSQDIEALRDRLSARDIAILHSVAEHQFLTIRHIEALHFAGHPPDTAGRLTRRAVARMRQLRLLGALDRRIGGVRSGSAGMVHFVDVVGHQVLQGRRGRHLHGFREPSQRFVNHHLAIADTHITLVQADRQGQIELAECAIEPASWRRFAGLAGARMTLKSDLYAETAATPDTDLVHAWFIEVDLGTEHIPTLVKKCRDYETYRRSGVEQADGGGFPLVIWSLAHQDHSKAERRRQALREAIDSDWTLNAALFRVIAPEQLVPLIISGGAA